MPTEIHLSAIEWDVTIQCRAAIDTATVNEYADRMTAADSFPPVDLFGTEGRYWIGDGWHRINAAKQIGALTIAATIHNGGRQDALRHALSANAQHGHRRTNADKRRCVEIALTEFASLSSRSIAQMCGVDHKTVEAARQVGKFPTSPVTGADGKQYPAKRKPEPMKQPVKKLVAERAAEIADIAQQGATSAQIAKELGISLSRVRQIAKVASVIVPADAVQHHVPRLDVRRVVESSIDTLSAISAGLEMVKSSDLAVGSEDAAHWVIDANAAMRNIRWLIQRLKEIANG